MRPWSLLFTLYGDPIRYYGGEVPISGLIRLMAEFGFTEGAVRAAVHRMSQQGWLTSRREARASYYSLSPRGQERIEEAADRIYAVEGSDWDGKWRLFHYSIPESHRKIREKLRKEMAWLGYGTLNGNAWIAPFDRLRQVRRLLQQYELEEHVQMFVADNVGPYSDRELVRKCWPVDEMKALYEEFIDDFEIRMADARKGTLSDAQAFVLKTLLVHEYRKFLFVDPGLPDELLETEWAGRRASKMFRDWYRELNAPAQRFFEAVCGESLPKVETPPFLRDFFDRPVDREGAGR
ncbi:phenylacetic acid degradation operon negative regulatory protein PaaX [Tumebacillus sp. DT12]|uniref:Phenylacetic acid degradation operon negative regulatory protein PaaX n=1 Tax=Tumebacillus lacus TaxID=2995335 RepID=A0ABT3X5L5_9BACL|nr:phenylacetic acid degradation operon negative regulatory protein PaaX [Tumebacillus lacus]MCX7572188.1 phenylacetic acid degradation operon negative regulatory protein PaaX [Tumebacillus lacus]